MCGVGSTVATGAGVRHSFLVGSELDEAVEIVGTQLFENVPKESNVSVRLRQTDLVHRVRLRNKTIYDPMNFQSCLPRCSGNLP